MKQVPNQNIYYSNFDARNLNKISTVTAKTKIRSVIMGICGSGKTTFINRVCNTNHKAGTSQGSLTRDIAYEDVAFFSKNIFRIYDTPGTTSNKNALEHAKILRASLTCIPLNLIIIQVKFQGRCNEMFENFSKSLQIFKGYQSMVVMLISCLDHVQPKQKQNTMEIFNKLQKEYEVNCPIVFYSNKDSHPECLSKLLYLIGQQKQPQLIKIDDGHFYKYFNVAKPKSTPKISVYVKQIQDQCNNYIKAFRQMDKNIPDIDDLVSQFKMFMKFSLKRLQDDQYKKYSVEFDNEHTTADLYLLISQMICSKMEEADFVADKLLTKTIQDEYHKEKADMRDMLKQCPNPNCGLIWMRVQGCNGQTHCGNKPSNYFDYFKNQISYKYTFNFDSKKGIFTFNKNMRKKIDENTIEFGVKQQKNFGLFSRIVYLFSQGLKENLSASKISRDNSQYGCKTQMVWKNLPRLQNIDEILKQYYGTSNFEQMVSSQKFLYKQHKKYEKEVESNAKKALNVMKNSE